jgi:hypothetical protein
VLLFVEFPALDELPPIDWFDVFAFAVLSVPVLQAAIKHVRLNETARMVFLIIVSFSKRSLFYRLITHVNQQYVFSTKRAPCEQQFFRLFQKQLSGFGLCDSKLLTLATLR